MNDTQEYVNITVSATNAELLQNILMNQREENK